MNQDLARQRVFDFVLGRLREQKFAARDANGGCKYRGVNGTKCAVGHLIHDNVYHADIEGSIGKMISTARNGEEGSVSEIAVKAIEAEWGLTLLARSAESMKNEDFLNKMQDAHDNYLDDGPGVFEPQMARIASRFGLSYTRPAA